MTFSKMSDANLGQPMQATNPGGKKSGPGLALGRDGGRWGLQGKTISGNFRREGVGRVPIPLARAETK